MTFRPNPEDYPEGSLVRKQLEAALDNVTAGEKPARSGGGGKMGRPEQELQIELMGTAESWPLGLLLKAGVWPRWIRALTVGTFLYHIPNGGYRTAAEAGIMRAMGQKAGVWDLEFMLPVLRLGVLVPGAYLECKAGNNGLTEKQAYFGQRARALGYATYEIRSNREFQEAIEDYLSGALPYAGINFSPD